MDRQIREEFDEMYNRHGKNKKFVEYLDSLFGITDLFIKNAIELPAAAGRRV